jgi:valyl-tRNA synthetase
MNLTIDKVALPATESLAAEDKWVLTAFENTVKNVRAALDNYEIGVALSTLYDFLWDVYCDWYIELCKARLAEKDTPENLVAQQVLCYVLMGTLKLLHPFMPFITEEIYGSLPHEQESIMVEEYPTYDKALDFTADAAHMERVIAAIRAIRVRRNEMNVPPSRRAKVYLATKYLDSFGKETEPFFARLASAAALEVAETFDESVISADSAVQIVTDSATIYLPLSDIIDVEKEKARLTAELQKLDAEIDRAEKKLSNESFVAKAPAAVVEGERQKLEKFKENRAGVAAALEKLA